MTVAVFNPNEQKNITVTEKANKFFKKKLEQESQNAIRISVKKSGCTGYAYVVEYCESQSDGDSEHDFDGLKIFVSSQAMEMIAGSEVDLEQQGINKNIVFNNPNVTASCGCGSSFSVAEEDA